jgi:lipid A disaccharide synthetase
MFRRLLRHLQGEQCLIFSRTTYYLKHCIKHYTFYKTGHILYFVTQLLQQHYTTLHNITQHHTTLNNITQHYTTLHNITQHHTTLNNITQHYTMHKILEQVKQWSAWRWCNEHRNM